MLYGGDSRELGELVTCLSSRRSSLSRAHLPKSPNSSTQERAYIRKAHIIGKLEGEKPSLSSSNPTRDGIIFATVGFSGLVGERSA